jgi:hypothetical protein
VFKIFLLGDALEGEHLSIIETSIRWNFACGLRYSDFTFPSFAV